MNNKLSVVLLIVSLLMFLFLLYLNYAIMLDKEEIIATLMVGNRAGFDANDTALTFGMITTGSDSNRELIVQNTYDFPIKLEFSVDGDIERFLVFDKTVHLDVGEEKTIGISTITVTDEPHGNYSGKVIITTKRDVW